MSQIDSKTRMLGILGRNISYTLSPIIHNFSLKQLELNQVYLPFDMSEDQIENFLDVFWSLGGVGLNVTTPYKEKVGTLIGASLGAVNTLYRGKKSWEGISTDGEGFYKGLCRLNQDLSRYKTVVILGNGGVVPSLVNFWSTQVEKSTFHILRRSEKKDAAFVKKLTTSNYDFHPFEPRALESLVRGKENILLVQATNAPRFGETLEKYVGALKGFSGIFVDLLYGERSALFDYARSHRIPSQDGIPMLIEQARLAQQTWWNGETASYAGIEAAIERELGLPCD